MEEDTAWEKSLRFLMPFQAISDTSVLVGLFSGFGALLLFYADDTYHCNQTAYNLTGKLELQQDFVSLQFLEVSLQKLWRCKTVVEL